MEEQAPTRRKSRSESRTRNSKSGKRRSRSESVGKRRKSDRKDERGRSRTRSPSRKDKTKKKKKKEPSPPPSLFGWIFGEPPKKKKKSKKKRKPRREHDTADESSPPSSAHPSRHNSTDSSQLTREAPPRTRSDDTAPPPPRRSGSDMSAPKTPDSHYPQVSLQDMRSSMISPLTPGSPQKLSSSQFLDRESNEISGQDENNDRSRRSRSVSPERGILRTKSNESQSRSLSPVRGILRNKSNDSKQQQSPVRGVRRHTSFESQHSIAFSELQQSPVRNNQFQNSMNRSTMMQNSMNRSTMQMSTRFNASQRMSYSQGQMSQASMMTSQRGRSLDRHLSKRMSSRSISMTRSRSRSSLRSTNSKLPEKEAPKAGKILTTIWILVGAELAMDLVTTAISFMALYGGGSECCGIPIDFGNLTLGITIPYLGIVLIELCILALAIKNTLCVKAGDDDDDDQVDVFEDEHGQKRIVPRQVTRYENAYKGHKRGKFLMRIVNIAVLLNPFLGCIICYALLYQTDSKNEALSIVGLEGGSILIQWICFILERERLNCKNFIIHVLPLIPLCVTLGLIYMYLEKGGVCFRSDEGTFFFEGCLVCDNGLPAEEVSFGKFECRDNTTEPRNEDFCSDSGGSFCWFDFS